MELQKIPLQEQLRRAKEGFLIHPEYAACAIRSWADMPIAAYMGGENEEAAKDRAKLRSLLNVTAEQEASMSYRDMAALIGRRKQQGWQKWGLEEAVRLLAAPAAKSYRKWKEAQDAKNTP